MTLSRKVWAILEPKHRAGAIWLACLMTIGMLLEMLGIGIVLPALALLAGDAAGHSSPLLENVRQRLGNPSDSQMVIGGLTVLVVVYAIKSVFLVHLAWRQSAFVADLQSRLSDKLFKLYLNQPWTFHLQRNSATLMRNISADVAQFAIVAGALLQFATEILMIAGIGALLLAVEPLGAIGVGVTLALATWLFQAIMQKRLTSWGTRRRHHEKFRNQHLHQGLGGAKDAKLLGRESFFIEQFSLHNAMLARLNGRMVMAGQLPRLWYELLAVVGLALLGAVLAWQGNTGTALFSRLGLFAVAAFRLLPSANRLMMNWQNCRYARPVIDAIYADLSLAPPKFLSPASTPLTLAEAITVDHVSFRYPGAAQPSLRDISLRIPRGTSLGVIGGSGAGKSTLVDILLGLLAPDQGVVRADGRDIHTCLRAWQDAVGYVPQTIYLTDDTLRANVAFGIPSDRIDDAAVARAVAAAQLDTFIESLPQGLDTFVGERGVRLSGGQRQRIGIARALYRDPAILVLDEATSALDTETESGVMAAVNDLHGAKTLIIVAHRISTVADCDELIKLEAGVVVKTGRFSEVTGA